MFSIDVLPQFLRDALHYGITVGIKLNLGVPVFVLDGFYKSGQMKIFQDHTETWYARDRYNKDTRIDDFDDLCQLHMDWWELTKRRTDQSIGLSEGWDQALLDKGYVKKVVTEHYQSVR